MDNAGTYALMILSEEQLHLPIGMLGIYSVTKGYYIYVGSALKGLPSRLNRHLMTKKLLQWHVDTLLLHTKAIQIWYSLSKTRLEYAWNKIIQELPRAIPVISGFNSSYCRCQSHLAHFLTVPSFYSFRLQLRRSRLPRLHRVIV